MGVTSCRAEPWDGADGALFRRGRDRVEQRGHALAYTCKKMKGKQYALSTNSDIYIYDLAAGTTVNITEGMMGYDKYPRFSPDDSMVAFTSMERDGTVSDKDRLFIAVLATGEKKYLTENFDYNAATSPGTATTNFGSSRRCGRPTSFAKWGPTVRRWRWSPAARTT